MKTPPKAVVIDASRPDVRTVYRVDGAGQVVNQVAKAYRVTTYPNSDLIFVESAETGRVVSPGVARRLVPVLKTAVIEAEARALYEADRDPGLALRGWDDTDPDIRQRFIEQAQARRQAAAP